MTKGITVLLVALACAPARPVPTLAISNVTIVDVAAGRTIPDRTVTIAGRHIVSVSDAAATVPQGIDVVDGRGKYLMPGLWDMHVHLDSADLPALVALGITGARDMGGDLEELLAWRGRIAAGDLTGPRLVIAGPALRGPRSPSDSGPWVIRWPWQGIAAVDSLAARHVDFIKIHEGILDDAYRDIAVQAKLRHLPFAGHVPAGVGVGEAAEVGQRSIEHLEFVPDACLGRFAERSPSAAPPPLPVECDETNFDWLLRVLAGHHTWLCPTIGSFRIFAPKQFPAIFAGFKDLMPLLQAHHIDLLAGTDLGSRGIIPGVSLHDELALLVDAGLSPAEALRTATLNPARFLGGTDSLGTIEPGKIADLVLLAADPLADIHNTRSIVAVIRAGKVQPARPLHSP